MKQIGIMGGTFDPIHNAHLLIAQAALEEHGLDKIIFVPTGNPPHKIQKFVTDAGIRYEMTLEAIKGNPLFSADDYEVKKTEYSYTSDTILYFRHKYPDARLFFIIGADSLAYLDKWHEPEIILRNAVILAYPRKGGIDGLIERARDVIGGDIRKITAPEFDVSSTQIRSMVHDGLSIQYLVQPAVEKFIAEHGLYKASAGK